MGIIVLEIVKEIDECCERSVHTDGTAQIFLQHEVIGNLEG